MQIYDVFNGDADGICALIQLRLAEPCDSTLVTGVKRDIALAQRVPVDLPARVNILDVSLDKNREAVDALLAAGCSVFYVDHHFPGETLPDAPSFTALNAAAVLMFPIALAISEQLGVSVLPFAIAVMFAASASFITPLGYQTNLMVYGPGRYRFTDYVRIGAPLSLLVGVVAVGLIPLVWGF